jgi:hypothetical protein
MTALKKQPKILPPKVLDSIGLHDVREEGLGNLASDKICFRGQSVKTKAQTQQS